MTTLITVESLGLPTQKSEIDNRWCVQKIGMIGAGGVGKSEFWAQGDKTLFIQTEAGLNHLKCMKMVARSWDDVRNIVSKLIQADNAKVYPYDTLVIDTIDEFIELANQEIIKLVREKFPKSADKINTLFDYPASSDAGNPSWTQRMNLVMNALKKIADLPSALVFIGHLGSKEIKTATEKTNKDTITIGGQLGASLIHWTDHFLNIQTEQKGDVKKRIVRTIPTQFVEAKSRDCRIKDGWEWVNPKSMTLEERTISAQTNYKAMRSLFN